LCRIWPLTLTCYCPPFLLFLVTNLQFPQAACTHNANSKIPLHYAAREGRLEMVDFFVRWHPHTAAIQTKKQKLPLHFAAGDGHLAVVQILLAVYPAGAALPSAKGKLPLHFAARWGHLQIAQHLLDVYQEGARAMDWEGSLPLHDAARQGQYEMTRFLVEQFPSALVTANLRGEIPLFPAVRSRNIDLVVFLVQAWPNGGKFILQNVSQDDSVNAWDWDVVELLLRGAVDNFLDCSILENKQAPSVCLSSGLDIVAACPSPDILDGSSGDDGTKQLYLALARECVTHPPENLVLVASDAGKAAVMEVTIPRSKSPLLEAETARKKRSSSDHSRERKRKRVESLDFGDDSENDVDGTVTATARERTFIELHAALECGASNQVIRHVLGKRPEQVKETDDLSRLPLHLAAMRCKTPEDCELVIEKILNPFPKAASIRDGANRLPLHVAIASQANVRIVAALLDANPAAGVELCQTNDEWQNQMPIHMACTHDCDLGTVYLLLRADPSSVPTNA